MYGTIINMVTVLIGTAIGAVVGSRFSERLREIAFVAIGLTTFLIGLQMAFKTQHLLVPMLSLLIGGLIGEGLKIEERLNQLGERSHGNSFFEGFIAASLLYCIGAMTILGAIEEGVSGTYKIYTLKAIMDGFASIAFATAMGWGVGLSALSILVVQGGLTLVAKQIQPFLTTPLINEISATGGLMLVALALGLLGIKKLPVAGFLPALVLAPFIFALVTRLPF